MNTLLVIGGSVLFWLGLLGVVLYWMHGATSKTTPKLHLVKPTREELWEQEFRPFCGTVYDQEQD